MKKNLLKVLIVEDTPNRQKALINLYKEHAWILVNTVKRAQTLLSAYSFDLISLDYDLAGPEKGDALAKEIKQSASAHSLIIIHSMNAPGAQRIIKVLPQALSIPFSKITRNNETFKRFKKQLRNGTNINWPDIFRNNT